MGAFFIALAIAFSAFMCGVTFTEKTYDDRIDLAINNSLSNMEKLKEECESKLPRNKECTLLYEYVDTEMEIEK